MVRELPVRIIEDPSRGFTLLPRRQVVAPDLVITCDLLGDDRIQLRMYGAAVPLIGSEHRVVVQRKPAEIRAVAARLRHLWKRELIDLQPLDERGRPIRGRAEFPYACQLDFTKEPQGELFAALDELANQGSYLLFELLLGGGDSKALGTFREILLSILRGERPLRIRIDSDLFLPWGMLALPRGLPQGEGVAGLFSRFLGYRHQIEHTSGHYPGARGAFSPAPPPVPVVSLNHDRTIDPGGRTRAGDVAAALAKNTSFTERTTRAELLRALDEGSLNEQLMYFWCHGSFRTDEGQTPCLVVRLTDGGEIDAYTVQGRPLTDEHEPFQPLVLLNACYAGLPSGADLAYLGRALIERGARGVIGPQIEMPQLFAAEYALAFVTRYLEGRETAGEIAHSLARHFADEYRNPLGFAYGLHGGMDERLERG
ncbi:CHAT domain-containing protein [Streptomyces albipurpureus]|uniref:CHAT domain-containing protein n=1 Tax=Streptomyces albipurpureus TaxID=2897419 RepID=A0ABT0ULT2_9ACTN|nr:CHAT domain-containing protein [Streptomyces sp. CWNU-1]MCM2389237.1 CHAT domain-containing protein [Streptomyces sp. CWNU-1]